MERDNRAGSRCSVLVLIYFLTLGLLFLPTIPALAGNPSITLISNKSNYVKGKDSFTLKYDIKAGTENNTVDIYFALQLPDNTFQFYTSQGQWSDKIVSLATSWNVSSAAGTVFEFQVPDITSGTYTFWAVFTQPGSITPPFISYSSAPFNLIKPFKSPSAIMAAHDPNSPSYNKACISCHGDRMSEESLDSKIKPAHRIMLPEYPGGTTVTNETCQACHSKGVDMRDESAVSLRRNTDVTRCVACHSSGTKKPFYQ